MSNSKYNVSDIGVEESFVPKSYVIDRYPELLDNFRFAGLWVFGSGSFGMLGDNTVDNKSSPVQTIASGTNWKAVSAGVWQGYASAGIKTDGTLWIWGYNGFGFLGDNTTTYRSSPVQTVAGGTNWKQISIGYLHMAAVKTDGTLWAWGSNSGKLGDNTTTNKSSPVQTVAGGTNWKQVSCGQNHTSAIKTDGTLWTWGTNANGILGTNDTTTRSSPVQTVTGGTNWVNLSSGYDHMAAIKTDGTLWLWGTNSHGQLGDDTTASKSSPVQTVAGSTNWKQLSCGSFSTSAIKTDGTLWTWGRNDYGQLGDNTINPKSSPVQTVSGGTNWKIVSVGAFCSSAIKTDGTLWLWGDNLGNLGNNSVVDKSSPVQTVSGGTNWRNVACGDRFTITIRDDSSDIL